MINDGNHANGGLNQPAGNVQISAKEFASKFRSKRGEYSLFRMPSAHAARGPVFGDGVINWQVTPGSNLFRRESSDLISFLFDVEAFNFLAGECQVYLPPYGKCRSLLFLIASS